MVAYFIFAFYLVRGMGLPLHIRKFPVHQQLNTTRKAAIRTEALRGLNHARLSSRWMKLSHNSVVR